MLTWVPGWGQLAVPVVTHLLIAAVLLRHSFNGLVAILFGLLLINALREARRLWPRIGRAIPLEVPEVPPVHQRVNKLNVGAGAYDPAIRPVIRVVWSLPSWVTVELGSPRGREVVDIFGSEMTPDELAKLRRWTQRDKQRVSRRRVAKRRADP